MRFLPKFNEEYAREENNHDDLKSEFIFGFKVPVWFLVFQKKRITVKFLSL